MLPRGDYNSFDYRLNYQRSSENHGTRERDLHLSLKNISNGVFQNKEYNHCSDKGDLDNHIRTAYQQDVEQRWDPSSRRKRNRDKYSDSSGGTNKNHNKCTSSSGSSSERNSNLSRTNYVKHAQPTENTNRKIVPRLRRSIMIHRNSGRY